MERTQAITVREKLVPATLAPPGLWRWYARKAMVVLQGGEFVSRGEFKAAVADQMLQMMSEFSEVNDAVIGMHVAYTARHRLYSRLPENWSTLQQWVASAAEHLTKSGRSELTTLAEVVLPECERLDIDIGEVYDPKKFGNLREAASALANVIRSPLPNGERREKLQSAIQFTMGSTRAEVRDAMRSWRGEPGRGTIIEHPDGTHSILIRAVPTTCAAIQQKLSREVSWGAFHKMGAATGPRMESPSKINHGEVIRRHAYVLQWEEGCVIDAETGEVKGALK